jgi:hypothetical protein
MVADLDRLNTDQPYKIKVFLQKFGGKVAGDNTGRGKARGLMTYKDITGSSQQEVAAIKETIRRVYDTIDQ